MQPIVDGLKTQYQNSTYFTEINASTNQGLKIFNAYQLFGHPSYLILNDRGEVLWQSVGEQTREFIERALISALEN